MSDKIPVANVLLKLNEMFKVIHISSPLVIGEDIDQAKAIHSEKNFNRIPIRTDGKILSYYDSNSNSEKKIESNDLISESAGIFKTFSYLSKRNFYFVLNGNDITDIVHYSDLNNPLALLGIYAQIAYCEKAIRDFARSINGNNNTESNTEKFLNDINNQIKGNKIEIRRAKGQFKNKKKYETETDLFDELHFDDELILYRELLNSRLDHNKEARFKNSINLEDSAIESYTYLRNDIMHSKPKIIKKSSDVKEWLKFLQTCQDIINRCFYD